MSATAVALVASVLAAPTATAADDDRSLTSHTSARAVIAARALETAEKALAGEGGNATLALRDLRLVTDALSPRDQARAAQLSARPRTNKKDCSSKVACIHWQSGETTAKWAKLVKKTTTKVGKKYVKAGFRKPKKDRGKGGNSKTDIYVDNLPKGLYGYCTIDNGTRQPGPGRYDVPAFCVVDNNYKGFPTNSPKENLQVTVAHEFFHAVQFAYDLLEDAWLMEATAAWVEDEVYPKVNDNLQYLKAGILAKPSVSMDKFDFASYGHWIFFRYLSEKFSRGKAGIPAVVLDIWKAADSKGGAATNQFSVQAINSALGARGTSFPAEFAKFSDANRRSRSVYAEGNKLKYPVAPLAGSDTLTTGDGGTLTVPLKHQTSATVQLKSSGVPTGGGLAMAFDLGDAAQGSLAVVTTYRKSGGPVTTLVPLNASGVGNYQAAFGSDAVSSVELTVVNASFRYTNCYSGQTKFACGGGTPIDEPVSGTVAVSVVP